MTGILKVDTIQKNNGTIPTAGDLGLNVTGNVIQVIQVNDATTYTVTSTSAYSTIVSANITLSSISSKVMIICGTGEIDISSGWGNARIFRSGTEIASLCTEFGRGIANTAETHYGGVSLTYLDSPSTISQITYSVGIKCQTTGTFRVGNGSKHYITLLEIVG
jgi:hypothetical protein